MNQIPTPLKGKIVAVSTSSRKGTKKKNLPHVELLENRGLHGDAHAGDWHRQVSLLATESIAKIREKGLEIAHGDFAENITTTGLKLWELPLGTQIALGKQALLEVTQIGKECHDRCAIYHQVGDCVMPREGIFARVLRGGTIKPGDEINITLPAGA